MSNKPVAWIWSEDGCNMGVCLDQDKQIGKQEFQDYSIPLYTHPVKELTDDEIIKTMVQFDVYSSDDHCLIEAGRAILRKASENERK